MSFQQLAKQCLRLVVYVLIKVVLFICSLVFTTYLCFFLLFTGIINRGDSFRRRRSRSNSLAPVSPIHPRQAANGGIGGSNSALGGYGNAQSNNNHYQQQQQHHQQHQCK